MKKPIDKTIDNLNPDGPIRNDSGMPTAEILDVLRREGVELSYGGLKMLVRGADLDQARRHAAGLTAEERQQALVSVDRTLRASLPAVANMAVRDPGRETMDDFYSDLMLWTALQEKTAS